jgi:hypothetical protein
MNARTVAVVLVPMCWTGLRGAAAADPAELPRAEVCLNGAWETMRNAGGEAVPEAGWSPRRVPELPIAGGEPPTTAIWYRLRVPIPRAWFRPDRRFVLTLEKVGHYAAIHCNGRQVGEHYGQFTPFESDLTAALRPGVVNEIAIFVHDASGRYARPGAVIDDPRDGNAYRGATERPEQRNWVGIVGDILLSWRPTTALADVQVTPSVRQRRLKAEVDTSGIHAERGPVTLRAAVLDGTDVVVPLPDKTLTGDGTTSLEAGWNDPVLWGPEPYGSPKLYVLRTELLRGGVVVDRRFTRFGFREVWVEGRDVLLNGKKLWMAGTYHGKLAPIGYLNDPHPQALALEVMQESGLNTLHGHWDDLGTPWLDRCDEMGMLVVAGFYCDGRPQIQSRADSGWEDWMADTCTQWTRTVRRHASIVLWRPIDIGPVNAMARSRELFNRLAERVRREDGTRPFVFGNDGSEVDAWSQSPLKDPRDKTAYDDGARLVERFTGSSKPFLTKEIYTGFADVENVSRFFRTFSEKSFALGSTGLIVQHLPLVTRSRPFAIEWLSPSGRGNRDISPRLSPGSLPNWCDASEPAWTPSPYSTLFRELATRFQKRPPAASRGERAGEILVTGLAADELALLVPRDPAAGEATGVRAAADGTAWIAPASPGDYELLHDRGAQPIRVNTQQGPSRPGYGDVERIVVRPNQSVERPPPAL